MLNLVPPENRAQIVTSILRETANGADVRACCRAQGITYQTFIDWRSWAQKENRLHGHEATAKRARIPDPPLQNALQAALTKVVDEAQGPDKENPPPFVPASDKFKASNGFTLPGPYCAAHMPPPDADFMAAVERDIAAQDAVPKPEPEPITATDEGQSMPRRKNEPEQSPMAQVLAARFPWLAELEARAIKEFGPKPDKDGSKAAYNRWIMNRKTLMNKSQLAEFEGFYGRGRAKAEATKRALREAAKGGKEPAAQPVNGKIKVTVETVEGTAAEIQALQAQHAELEQQLALHPEALSHAVSDPRSEPISEGPRRVANRPTWTATATASAADMAEEIARMQRIITVLTAENMRLRGIL